MTRLSRANLNNGAAVCPQGEGRESTSTFPAYLAYKTSRVEWVEALPAHWGKVALKWVSRIFAGGTPDKTKTHYWENGSIPWLNSGSVNQVLISEPSAFITTEAFNSSSARWIPPGSLVMALAGQGKTKGMVAQLAIRTTCNQSMAAITPIGNVKPRYLFWWLSSNYQNIRNMAGGDLRDGLNLELIGDIPTPMPSEEEQTQISRFLDHETARIDALIEEQQSLIELLKEKRQAVISHAVTKGLDPTVPVKDSGVEWLGEVPAHWAVSPLKFLVEEKVAGPYGASLTKAMYTNSGYRVYGQQHVISDDFSIGDYYISEEKFGEMQRYVVFPGDVLVSVMGTIGRVSVVPIGVEVGIINPRLVRYKFSSGKVVPEFVKILLMSLRYQSRLREESQGSTMEGLNMVILGDLPLVLPPLDVQHSIVTFVKNSDSNFNELVSQATWTVDLLQERRSALVSAAVTGKIDIRGWQPSASVPTPELAQEAV
ncbi:restriction endonuclease subunit S [Pseudomonas lurida]|uniref:restriction endonuclease subunit S n=1 Tax=Pseudomonas lurida TaxID=244566 RepID=UPI003D28D876